MLEHPNDNQKNDENKPLASFGDFTDELSPEYNERINNNQKIVNDIAQKNKINQTKHTSDYDDDFGFSPQNITNKNKQSELFHKLYQLSDDLNLYDKEIDLKNNTDKSNFKTAVNMLKINLNDIKNQAQKTINENELNTLIKRIDQQNESFINLKKVHENEFKE